MPRIMAGTLTHRRQWTQSSIACYTIGWYSHAHRRRLRDRCPDARPRRPRSPAGEFSRISVARRRAPAALDRPGELSRDRRIDRRLEERRASRRRMARPAEVDPDRQGERDGHAALHCPDTLEELMRHALCVTVVLAAAAAQAQPPFTLTEVMIPVRDGVHLQTAILTPVNQSGPLPILFRRTPYGVPSKAPDQMPASFKELAADGYIFVIQNLRGRFKSEGTFALSSQVNLKDST